MVLRVQIVLSLSVFPVIHSFGQFCLINQQISMPFSSPSIDWIMLRWCVVLLHYLLWNHYASDMVRIKSKIFVFVFADTSALRQSNSDLFRFWLTIKWSANNTTASKIEVLDATWRVSAFMIIIIWRYQRNVFITLSLPWFQLIHWFPYVQSS